MNQRAKTVSPQALLGLPYRDRQLIVVMPERVGEMAVQREDVAIGDYLGPSVVSAARDLYQGKSIIEAFTGTKSTSDFVDRLKTTKGWGLFGYAIDKARQAMSPGPAAPADAGPGPIKTLLRVRADIAEQNLQFPAGHPLYETVYAGHPLRPGIYRPLASFHHFLFEDKFNELLRLLSALSASEVTINYVRGYRTAFGGQAGLSLPLQVPVDISARFDRQGSSRSEGALKATFTPSAEPVLPADMAWFGSEPTWQQIAEARMARRLREIDVELSYEDDFGVNGTIAAQLLQSGFKLGGEFKQHEQTSWKFHSVFAS